MNFEDAETAGLAMRVEEKDAEEEEGGVVAFRFAWNATNQDGLIQ